MEKDNEDEVPLNVEKMHGLDGLRCWWVDMLQFTEVQVGRTSKRVKRKRVRSLSLRTCAKRDPAQKFDVVYSTEKAY